MSIGSPAGHRRRCSLEEQARLHRLPDVAFTAAFGETRKVSWTSTICFGGVTYSVPHTLVDQVVWVRVDGDEIVATHIAGVGRGRGRPTRAVDAGQPDASMTPTTRHARPGRWPANPRPRQPGRGRVLRAR